MKKYKGIFPALITPYKQDGSINNIVLKKLVKKNIEKGVKGFYVGGSTAEAFLLKMDERKEILDIVMEEAGDYSTIIYHIGSISTDFAIELAEYAEKLGVDAISSIPPFYYKFSIKEIKSYYNDIINNVNLPMIIYNFPAFSGVEINSENGRSLFQNDRIIGVKYTSHDFYKMEQIKKLDNNLIIFNGHDEVFLAGLAMGADGAIGSTFNFMAEKYIAILELFQEKNIEEARKIQIKVNEIIKVLIKVGVNQGVKYILQIQGLDCGKCRRPFKWLDRKEKLLLEEVVKKNI